MNLNSVTIAGRVGKDPDLSYTQSGKAVCKFSVATNFIWKDIVGEKQEKTTWHNVVVWGKTAEFVKEYVSKGDLILIEGSIDNKSYDDKDGNKKYISEIIAKNVQLGPRKQGDNLNNESSQNDSKYDGDLPF